MYDWGMGWSWGAGMVVMALLWVFVIAAVIWVIATLLGPRRTITGTTDRTALRVLEDRLARGEMDVDEFRARRTAIEEHVT